MASVSRALRASVRSTELSKNGKCGGTHTHSARRVRRQPRKKKHSLLSWFGGGGFLFKKGKGVFLSGFCPPGIRTGGV